MINVVSGKALARVRFITFGQTRCDAMVATNFMEHRQMDCLLKNPASYHRFSKYAHLLMCKYIYIYILYIYVCMMLVQ